MNYNNFLYSLMISLACFLSYAGEPQNLLSQSVIISPTSSSSSSSSSSPKSPTKTLSTKSKPKNLQTINFDETNEQIQLNILRGEHKQNIITHRKEISLNMTLPPTNFDPDYEGYVHLGT